MPIWLHVAIWIIWFLWFVLELVSAMQVIDHNNSPVKVALMGPARYTKGGMVTTLIFIVVTILLISYTIARLFS
jgi:hypothetical protein